MLFINHSFMKNTPFGCSPERRINFLTVKIVQVCHIMQPIGYDAQYERFQFFHRRGKKRSFFLAPQCKT